MDDTALLVTEELTSRYATRSEVTNSTVADHRPTVAEPLDLRSKSLVSCGHWTVIVILASTIGLSAFELSLSKISEVCVSCAGQPHWQWTDRSSRQVFCSEKWTFDFVQIGWTNSSVVTVVERVPWSSLKPNSKEAIFTSSVGSFTLGSHIFDGVVLRFDFARFAFVTLILTAAFDLRARGWELWQFRIGHLMLCPSIMMLLSCIVLVLVDAAINVNTDQNGSLWRISYRTEATGCVVVQIDSLPLVLAYITTFSSILVFVLTGIVAFSSMSVLPTLNGNDNGNGNGNRLDTRDPPPYETGAPPSYRITE